ncbi:MAG TPA: hypothetical protein VJH22_05385 [Candidatus Nanoarchaeia archaeon]|nr:hypothetical protein [Candidatus Nanoarchaeia archaeon]
MRRANIEVQFNWVFVLIAGSVILLAFFSFIMKQKAAHDQSLAESLVKDIVFLAEGASSAKKAWQVIDGTSGAVEPRCSEECSCTLNVGSFSKEFGDLSLFIPSPLEGDKLVFWSQDWVIPFRVGNFLYMSSKNIKYWFVYAQEGDPLLDEITSIFPRELNTETIALENIGTIEDEDYEVIKIILLNVGPLSAQDFASKLSDTLEEVDVKGVNIDSGAKSLTFYEKIDEDSLDFVQKQAPFTAIGTLLGAIFAQDATMYSCQVEKSLERAQTIAKIYAQRTRDLNTQGKENCGYENAITILDGIAATAADLSLGLENKRMDFPMEDLEQINRDLLNQGCPLVY